MGPPRPRIISPTLIGIVLGWIVMGLVSFTPRGTLNQRVRVPSS